MIICKKSFTPPPPVFPVLNKKTSTARKNLSILFTLLFIFILGFSACGNPADSPEQPPPPQTAAEPTAAPPAGDYGTTQDVSFTSATAGAAIYYTLDGTEPTTASTLYTNPINVSSYARVKAIAVKEGMNNSAVLTAVYTITRPGYAVQPLATPAEGVYDEEQSVTLASGTEGASIYYTVDGTTPTAESTLYENPITISETTTLKAIAVKEGLNNSEVLTAVYTNNNDDTEDFGPGAEINQTFTIASTSDWDAALTEIHAGGNDKNYVINISADFQIEGSTVNTFGDVTGLKVSIRGNRTVSMPAGGTKGLILRISAGQSVVVRDVDFTGMTDNTASLISLSGNDQSQGELILRGSASVSGNTVPSSSSSGGSGVSVGNGGTFTMQDTAAVSGNTSSSYSGGGGGVYVGSGGTFTMQDMAVVSSNTASYNGGGVYVNGGTFTMQDTAAVSDNTADYYGGGVYVGSGGTFTMQDTVAVSDNTGGGVAVLGGTFTMQDTAAVSDNTADYSGGGGVYVSGGTFTMQDTAAVSDNTASRGDGGGVYVLERGTFTMQDTAAVSGNTASTGGGGGVYVAGGTFQIVGGTVYGNTAGNNSNVVKDTNGTSVNGRGAAFGRRSDGTLVYGVIESGTFTARGNLNTTDNTIEVVNGELQP